MWHRPTIAFARADSGGDSAPEPGQEPSKGELKGSGRSIPGLHLRDALDLVAKRAPDLILRFGGHAAAAGLTIREQDFIRFTAAFEAAVREMLPADALAQTVQTDGSLEAEYLSLATAHMLEAQVWGQGFPQPLYRDQFSVNGQRVVGGKHLRLKLRRGDRMLEAMRFNDLAPTPAAIQATYRLGVNEFNGVQSLQLVIEHWEPA